jgi:hypothetical protein
MKLLPGQQGILFLLGEELIVCFAVLEFELRASLLLGRCSTT